MLNWAALQDTTPEISDKEMIFVHFVMSSLPIREKTHQKLVTETAKDGSQKLHQISTEWPEHRHKIDHCFWPYNHHNSVVTYQDGSLFKDQQIIALSTLRLEMRKILHQGQLRIEKTKSQARQSLSWLNMNAVITDMISNCGACRQYKNR